MTDWTSHLGDCIKYDANDIDPHIVWDVVVIGSGIGGLTTASLLAQSGQKVLVLEQHWAAGGCMHTFESKGYRFGTGIHYVGNMHEGGTWKKILDSLTPHNDPVVWDRIEEPCETTILGPPSARYERCSNHGDFKAYLFEQFPSEEKGIEEYFQSVKEAAIAFNRSLMFKTLPLSLVKFIIWIKLLQFLDWGYSKWASISLQQALEKMTQNKELQSLLASNYGLCGTDPSRSPFILHAAIMSGGRHGAYYPNGGPSTIPNKIIKNLVAHQGQVMVCANVKQILVEKEGTMNVCKGVEMSDGTKIQAKAVVSDTGLINTANHMLPAGILQLRVDDDHISPQSTKHLHPSQTCLSLFVGLQMDPDTLNLPKAGIFFIHPSNDLISNMEKLEMMTVEEALSNDSITDTMEGEELHLGPIFVNPACVHDKSWPQDFPDKSTIEILALCPYSWFAKFEHDKDKDYEEMKTRFADKTWQRVVDILGTDCPKLPRSLEGVDNFKLGTPLTLAHFLASDHGAMIGLDHNMKRFEPEFHFLRLRSKVPEVSGLFITGQDIVCAGFPGAMVGGLFCAATMLGVGDPFTLVVDKDSK